MRTYCILYCIKILKIYEDSSDTAFLSIHHIISLNFNHSNGCVLQSHCSLLFLSLLINYIESLLTCLLINYIHSWVKCFYKILLHLKFYSLSFLSMSSITHILWTEIIFRYMFPEYHLSFCESPVHLKDNFFL